MKRIVLFFCFFSFLVFAVPLWAKGKSFEISGLFERFNWKEFSNNGTLGLEENGLKYGVNISWWNKEALTYYTFWNFIIYGGNSSLSLVEEYSNNTSLHTLDGETPVNYFGIRGQVGIGFPTDMVIGYIPINTVLYVCLVFDYWSKSRNLIVSKDLSSEDVEDDEELEQDEELWRGEENVGDEGGLIDSNEDIGNYKESWTMLSWKTGLKTEIGLDFVKLGVNLWLGSDILSRKKINFSDIDFDKLADYSRIKEIQPETIELKPDGSFFYGIDLTLKLYKFFITGYYKYFKWNKSDKEKFYVEYDFNNNYNYSNYNDYNNESSTIIKYQPESEERDYGIVVGLVF